VNGLLLQATINALLALYGQPEPHPTATLDEIAGQLRQLAADRRWEMGREKRVEDRVQALLDKRNEERDAD